MERAKERPKVQKVQKSPHLASPRQKALEESWTQMAAVRKQELEHIPYGPYGILNWKCNENESLENQVKSLKERVCDLEIYVRNSIRNQEFLEGDFFAWNIIYPTDFPREFDALFIQSWNFVESWGAEESPCLTRKQKQQVIASLKGYVVQEDFDSIRASLHPIQQGYFHRRLAEMFINKVVVETFFHNLFWYVDENAHPDDNGKGVWKSATPLGERLNTLYGRFQKVGKEYSHVWRTITIRLCNSVATEQTRDLTFGEATRAHRDAKCAALASKLLANKTLLCLLKKTDEQERRLDNLSYALQHMAQSAVDMNVQIPFLGFRTLDHVDTRFSETSDTIEAESYSFAYDDKKECRIKGHRVLGITRPYVFRTANDPKEEKEIELVCKAAALVEDEMSKDVGTAGKAE
ncbi:hypothetical protein BJY00DRAFT_318630 [Aspergillus carlsbadensis]|nr:hypothetical protein BJY00DRAFT_318630 [Aspergillus carlsbadensis]